MGVAEAHDLGREIHTHEHQQSRKPVGGPGALAFNHDRGRWITRGIDEGAGTHGSILDFAITEASEREHS